MPALDDFERPHEAVEAAVGFQVSGHIGDDGISSPEDCATGSREGGFRIGAKKLRVDALMDDGDLIAVDLGMALLLPDSRAHARIANFEAGDEG